MQRSRPRRRARRRGAPHPLLCRDRKNFEDVLVLRVKAIARMVKPGEADAHRQRAALLTIVGC